METSGGSLVTLGYFKPQCVYEFQKTSSALISFFKKENTSQTTQTQQYSCWQSIMNGSHEFHPHIYDKHITVFVFKSSFLSNSTTRNWEGRKTTSVWKCYKMTRKTQQGVQGSTTFGEALCSKYRLSGSATESESHQHLQEVCRHCSVRKAAQTCLLVLSPLLSWTGFDVWSSCPWASLGFCFTTWWKFARRWRKPPAIIPDWHGLMKMLLENGWVSLTAFLVWTGGWTG